MKRKTLTLIISLALAVSLSACGNDKFQSENNSDAERIAELEQELEELKAQQSQDNDENFDAEQEESQQPINEVESLLKATVESPETSGVCGANLTWYYQNGVLAIAGTGEMTDYSSREDTPWYDIKDKIGWVIIDDGATTVGENAFYKFPTLSKVVLPDTLTSIGYLAFSECDNIKEITLPNTLTSIGESAFSGCNNIKEITLPKSLTSIGYHAFSDEIEKIIFLGNIPEDLSDFFWNDYSVFCAWDHEPTEEELLKEKKMLIENVTVYYTGDTFDELINSYPYWSDYGVNWIKQ